MFRTAESDILLVVPPGVDAETLLAKAEGAYSVDRSVFGGGRFWSDGTLLTIDRGGPFFEDDEELCADYRGLISSFDPETWGSVSIGFDAIDACRALLALIADDATLIVDTDHGYFARGDQFVARCVAEPTWDWRVSAKR